jgi:hypothetical protein
MTKAHAQSTVATTARNIAYGMIAIYGATLIIVGVVAAFKSSQDSQTWMELFKSGFLLLGGALTTIIGYYFGSRGVQEAQELAEKASEELEKQKSELAALREEMAPTTDEEEETLIPEGEDLPEDL